MLSEIIQRASRKLGRLRIVDVAKLHTVHEVRHLSRLFDYLGVDIVYDIGANQGQYAQMLRNKVGYKGVIVSVEPIPEMVDVMQSKAKGDAKWHIEAMVISNVAGDHTFNITKDRQCSSLNGPITTETVVYQSQTSVVEKISVKGITLGQLVTKWRGVYKESRNPFVKLDTQGFDLQIMDAAEDVRRSFVGFQSELSIKRLYHNSCRMELVLEAYKAYGFDVSALVPNNSGNFPDLIEVDCIMIRSDLVPGSFVSDNS